MVAGSHNKLSDQQRRALFGIGRFLRLDIDDLRDIASQYNNGIHSISSLKQELARLMIYDLIEQQSSIVGQEIHEKIQIRKHNHSFRPGSMSKRDRENILILAQRLNWSSWDLKAWLRKWFHVMSVKKLTANRAQKAIMMLKRELNPA